MEAKKLGQYQTKVRDQLILDYIVIPLCYDTVSSMFSFILVKQKKKMGMRTELDCQMWLCGAGTGREGGDVEGQCEVPHTLLPKNSAPRNEK